MTCLNRGPGAARKPIAAPALAAELPIIVVTADAGRTIEADCKAAGADDLVLKPVPKTTLFEAIGALIAKRGAGQVMLA